MTRGLSLVAAFVILGACATHELPARVETSDFASGTRLLAHVWDVEGALVLQDFFDTARGESCAFAQNEVFHVGPGPSYFCLPLQMAEHDPVVGPFADEACSVPVALANGDAPAAYALVRPANACTGAPEVHRANAPSNVFPWTRDGDKCVNAGAAATVQTLGDLVPLDAFARATEVVLPPGAGRIGATVAVTADGARFTVGGHDATRNEPVRIDGPAAGPFRWVPSRVAFVGAGTTTYGDAACKSPVATKTGGDAACPLSAALVFQAACANAATFHVLGAAVSSSNLWSRGGDGTCDAASVTGTLTFAVGDPIPDAAFAAATEVRVGRHRGYAGPGDSVAGDVAQWTDVLDVVTAEPCAPVMAVDGVPRCLPAASASISLFSDAACTLPAYAEPLTGCDQPTPSYVRDDAEPGATGVRAYQVTGEVPALFQKTRGACATFTPTVASKLLAVTEVDVARFTVAVDRTLR